MTPAMREVYDHLVRFIDEHGFSPTYSELSGITGKSCTAVYMTVKRLEQFGYVEKRTGLMRSIEISRDKIDSKDIGLIRSYLVEITTTQQLSKAQDCAREALRCLP